MPFRPRLFPAAAAAWTTPPARHHSLPLVACASLVLPVRRRAFHSSGPGRLRAEDGGKNHYERLNVHYDATPAEIKKSFYALSKTHHPDVNPSDPDAAHNFSRISESYHVLSSATRRAAYDRDVLRLHHGRPTAAGSSAHRGSYHSTNPAGGRAPSGLSRRRGTFRGPPPSFYRSGGWGAHSEKRKQAHEESTGTGGDGSFGHRHSTAGTGPSSGTYSHYGGMGPGGDPFGHRDEVPHFDKEGHTRTHKRQDERRSQRERRAVGDDDIEFEPQTSLAGHFFIVSGILAATFLAPLVYLQMARSNRKKKEQN